MPPCLFLCPGDPPREGGIPPSSTVKVNDLQLFSAQTESALVIPLNHPFSLYNVLVKEIASVTVQTPRK